MAKTPAVEYDAWLASLDLPTIKSVFSDLGCTHILVKVMTGNQGNSKQQIYCGGDYSQISRIAMGDPVAHQGTSQKKGGRGKAIFRAPVKLSWLGPRSFQPLPAPRAQLIYYPQYPEVRLSGFLAGCEDPPSSLLSIERRGKEDRRTLLLGVGDKNGETFGLMLPPEALAIDDILDQQTESYGPFRLWSLGTERNSSSILFADLRKIISYGPQFGRKLNKYGAVEKYTSPNAGGYTLEALLGVSPNGEPLPDYLGWEIKAHVARTLEVPVRAGRLTLLTPEPDGGVYVTSGVQRFLEVYGYSRKLGRIDFAGALHVGGPANKNTGVRLSLMGYRSPHDFDADGMVAAIHEDTIVASWSFEKILGHWRRKHAKTAYVPYQRTPAGDFTYGRWCSFGEGTSFAHLLAAFANGTVIWDPGIKSELSSTGMWRPKRRNQFRTGFQHLAALYDSFVTTDVLERHLGN